jgi:hypothetical protein
MTRVCIVGALADRLIAGDGVTVATDAGDVRCDYAAGSGLTRERPAGAGLSNPN